MLRLQTSGLLCVGCHRCHRCYRCHRCRLSRSSCWIFWSLKRDCSTSTGPDRVRQGSTGREFVILLELCWTCFDLLWSALLFLNVSQLPCCFSMFMALLFVAAGQLQELTLTIRAHDPWSWWCYAFWSPSLAQISWKRGGLTQSTKHSIPTIPTHFKKLFLWQRTIK